VPRAAIDSVSTSTIATWSRAASSVVMARPARDGSIRAKLQSFVRVDVADISATAR
jgi:hypothetical protein